LQSVTGQQGVAYLPSTERMNLQQIACDIQQVIKDRKQLQEIISRTGWETLSFHSRGVSICGSAQLLLLL